MHDRIAELAGLRAELAACRTGPRETRRDKTDQVQAQIDRVRGELEAQAEQLDARAEALAAGGQDIPAAEAATAARALRTVLDDDQGTEDVPPHDPPPPEPGPFDPREHGVEDVRAHLDSADENEVMRVLDAEAAAKKPRKSLTEQREAFLTAARARAGATRPGGTPQTTQAPSAPEQRTGGA